MALTQVTEKGIKDGEIVNADVNASAAIAGSKLAASTTSVAGSMSAADKTKLDGIAASANNYTHPTSNGNKHIPADGSSGQFLKYDSAGTAVWAADNDTVYTHPNHSGDVTSSGDGATTIADNAVTLAKMAGGTDGQIITYDANGDPIAVGPGTDGQVLTSTGAGSPPAFEDAAGGVTTDGQSNTVIGTNAGDAFDGTNATYNTLVGYDAGTDLTTGDYNTVLGADAFKEGTTASENVAIGMAALKNSTAATNNVAIGTNALREGTDAFDDCVAIGKNAGYNLGAADWNVAIGSNALYAATTSPKNVCIGYQAGYAVSTGNGKNIYIGHGAGSSGTTGYYNVLVGAESALSANTGQYQFVFGPISSKGDGTFHVTGTNGAYNQANNSSWSTTSDRRIKKNIVNNNVGLSIINQVQVKNFEYKTLEEIETDDPDLTAKACVVEKSGTQLGVIAQEMESILPSSVVTLSSGAKSVNEDELFWHMLNAIKELSAKVTALESG